MLESCTGVCRLGTQRILLLHAQVVHSEVHGTCMCGCKGVTSRDALADSQRPELARDPNISATEIPIHCSCVAREKGPSDPI